MIERINWEKEAAAWPEELVSLAKVSGLARLGLGNSSSSLSGEPALEDESSQEELK